MTSRYPSSTTDPAGPRVDSCDAPSMGAILSFVERLRPRDRRVDAGLCHHLGL